jgi:alginate O-acetyltransferase complex protein AlgI
MIPIGAIAATTVPFSLLSPSFVVFAGLSVGVLLVLRGHFTRVPALTAFNLVFLLMIGLQWQALVVLLVTLHIVYWTVKNSRTPAVAWAKPVAITMVFGLWVALFLSKNGDLFGNFSPFVFFNVTTVGVSYFAFRAIATIMDAPDIEDFDYASFMNYMMFFPTVLAGPIERYAAFQSAHAAPEAVDTDMALASMRRIVLGFVKKFVLADNLAPLGIFSFGADPQSVPIWLLWIGVLSQLGLIFLDFSGYCDIMIGLARLMGFKIQENFAKPYTAHNIQQFWDRWHMSLTFFVRDYVFTPIAKVIFRRVPRKQQFPYVSGIYFFTMLVIALWHQLTFGFLIFGIMHGAALVALQLKRRYLDKTALAQHPIVGVLINPPAALAIAITWLFFSVTTVAWYFKPSTTMAVLAKLIGFSI